MASDCTVAIDNGYINLRVGAIIMKGDKFLMVGNQKDDYFYPVGDGETVLLIDSWENQEAIDVHHETPMMGTIVKLREKYNLHMKVERYISNDEIPEKDKKFIKE